MEYAQLILRLCRTCHLSENKAERRGNVVKVFRKKYIAGLAVVMAIPMSVFADDLYIRFNLFNASSVTPYISGYGTNTNGGIVVCKNALSIWLPSPQYVFTTTAAQDSPTYGFTGQLEWMYATPGSTKCLQLNNVQASSITNAVPADFAQNVLTFTPQGGGASFAFTTQGFGSDSSFVYNNRTYHYQRCAPFNGLKEMVCCFDDDGTSCATHLKKHIFN